MTMASTIGSGVSVFSSIYHCAATRTRPSALSVFLRRRPSSGPRSTALRVQTIDFTGSFFEEDSSVDVDGEEEPSGPSAASAAATMMIEAEEPPCPPGLRRYETMAVLRPDMSEDERLAFTHKYEELLVAGGGMYVEVFNRGVIPLAYDIKRKNKDGETNTYLDGIYLLFNYCTKPESMKALESRLQTDDNVIRSSSFKIRKRKY